MANQTLKLAVGGPVQAKQGTYLTRPADELLLNACRDSKFAYVLACRQIGKSSLMFETSQKLTQAGIRTALIDLNSIGQRAEADEWYFSLLDEIARHLKLEVDVQTWWESRPRLSTRNQRLLQFLREVVLKEIGEPVVIFVDEIDMTLGLDFTDDFFAAIRSVHNDRAQYPAFQRLTFVLLGVATPDELIRDHTRTPFNIGQAILLRDFTKEECEPFRLEIEAKYPQQGPHYFDRIFEWTAGHPYLTQKLCEAVLAAEPELEQAESGLVDRLVRERFLAAEARSEDNLHFVQYRVTGDPFNEEMLKIYRQVLEGDQPVPDNEQSPPINRLKLYGLILANEGQLQVRNKLYARVFDLSWANEMLRLSSASFRLGLPPNYRVIQELGQGGFSTVYLTQLRDSDTSQSLALKVLRKDAINNGHQLRRFKQEARTVSKLDHPNIIHIYETGGEDKETFFIAMEYIPSGTVRHRLKSGPLSREEAVHIVKRIGSALTYAHEQGVIHRDIKPGNILLDTSQQPVRPVLTDFGLIKLLATDDLSKIESSAVLGTFDYMAPEQWRRDPPTPATDVYALAITFFEMLSGKRPFVAESPFELMNKHANDPLPLLSEVAPQVGPYFDEVLRKAAAKNPAERFQSMAEFMAAIDGADAKAEQVEKIEQESRAATTIEAVTGYIRKDRYDPEKALTMIAAALEIYPDYVAALRLRGQIYLEQNEIEKALQDFQLAYQQVGDPASEVGLEYLKVLSQVADKYWLRQMYQDAVQYYDIIRQLIAGEEPALAFIQEIWAEARARLIDFHHHEGVLAYAGGDPEELNEAITVLKQKIQALADLNANNEGKELQDKLVQLQVIRYQKIIREAEQSIEEIGSKSSTIRFSTEEIFQHYQVIDEAYRALLEFKPENEQWHQERRKRLQACAQSRFVFARRALAKLDPDYEGALRHYEAVLEIEQKKYPGLVELLNLDLTDKIDELRKKVNYDGKYNEIMDLIHSQNYQAALERLDREFIQTGNYGHRDVARWVWGLVFADQHEGNFPPEWESLTGFESLSRYLVQMERARIQQLRAKVEPWSHPEILKTIDHENKILGDFEELLKDVETILDETAACSQAEIPDLKEYHQELERIEAQIQAQRRVFFRLDVNETAQTFEAWLQKIEEIEALLQTGDPVKDIPQFLTRIDAEQQVIENDATFGGLQALLSTNTAIGQKIDELRLRVPEQLVRLLIRESGQKEAELARARLESSTNRDKLTELQQRENSLQQRVGELERLYQVYSASLIPALILGGVIGILVMMTGTDIQSPFWVLFIAVVVILIWVGGFLYFQRRG